MWPLAIMIILLGIFGALFSLKHYERFRFHMKCAAQYRNALEKALPRTNLASHRVAAEWAHKCKYKRIGKIHLFVFWTLLNLAIAMLGAALLLASLRSECERRTTNEAQLTNSTDV